MLYLWIQGVPLLMCAFYLVVLVFSATVHEVAHAWTAWKLGDSTAKFMGRITLNPRVHLTKMGFLAMLLLPIGWANPVMINTRNFRKPKRDTILVSIAGPLSNLLLCFVSILILVVLGKVWGVHIPPTVRNSFDAFCVMVQNVSPLASALVMILTVFASLNALLCVFNLIPFPPLDGSKLLTSFLPYKAREWVWRMEQYGIIVLFLVINILSPFLGWLENLIVGGIYKGLYGLFF